MVGGRADRQHEAGNTRWHFQHILCAVKRNRQRRVRRSGRERIYVHFFALLEKFKRGHARENSKARAIHDKLLDQQAQHNDAGKSRHVRQKACAQAVGGVENQGENRIRRHFHRPGDNFQGSLKNRIEDFEHRMIFFFNDQAEGIAKDQGEHHQGNDFATKGAGCGVNRVLRNQIDKILIPGLVSCRGNILLNRNYRCVFRQFAQVKVRADARFEQVGQTNGNQNRQGAQQQREGHRATCYLAETAAGTQFINPHHQRRRQQRYNNHENHAKPEGTDKGEDFRNKLHEREGRLR